MLESENRLTVQAQPLPTAAAVPIMQQDGIAMAQHQSDLRLINSLQKNYQDASSKMLYPEHLLPLSVLLIGTIYTAFFDSDNTTSKDSNFIKLIGIGLILAGALVGGDTLLTQMQRIELGTNKKNLITAIDLQNYFMCIGAAIFVMGLFGNRHDGIYSIESVISILGLILLGSERLFATSQLGKAQFLKELTDLLKVRNCVHREQHANPDLNRRPDPTVMNDLAISLEKDADENNSSFGYCALGILGGGLPFLVNSRSFESTTSCLKSVVMCLGALMMFANGNAASSQIKKIKTQLHEQDSENNDKLNINIKIVRVIALIGFGLFINEVHSRHQDNNRWSSKEVNSRKALKTITILFGGIFMFGPALLAQAKICGKASALKELTDIWKKRNPVTTAEAVSSIQQEVRQSAQI